MAAASYEAIIEAIAARLRTVDGIGKVADIDDEVGPTWEKLPKANDPYWFVTLGSEEQQGKSAAGRQVFERPSFRVDGSMPVNRRLKSGHQWLKLIKAASNALRSDPTLGSVVGGCDLPRIAEQDDNKAVWAIEGRGEFQCHHVVIELTVTQFVIAE